MAAHTGTGFRIDGSLQYGGIIRGEPAVSLENAIARVSRGQHPFPPGDKIDEDQRRAFEQFVELAHKKNIALVGISMAYDPLLVRALDNSTQHDIWKEFQTPEFADWIRRHGVLYFNFTQLESFSGKADEFVDPMHPSEPAYLRMLLTMLRDPGFRTLFPALDSTEIEKRLGGASRLEVYRNEF
jgi:hypothetical protein